MFLYKCECLKVLPNPIPKTTRDEKNYRDRKQAGAELCQAQAKLGLANLGSLL